MSPSLVGHVGPAGPDDAWSAWSADPVVLVTLVVFVVLYWRGVAAAVGRPTVAAMVRRRALAAAGAVVVLVVALVSPVDAVAESLFSVHMVQHLLLSALAAPLLVLAAPGPTIRRGLPPAWRRGANRLARLASANRTRGAPVAASTLLAVTVLTLWHAPTLYEAAVRDDVVHAFEHVTILGASALFWSTVVHAARRSQLLSSVAGLAVASAHGAALGALLALAPRPWYPVHADGARAWSVEALADQQVAGTIMWVPTVVVYLGAMAGLLHRALADDPPSEQEARYDLREA